MRKPNPSARGHTAGRGGTAKVAARGRNVPIAAAVLNAPRGGVRKAVELLFEEKALRRRHDPRIFTFLLAQCRNQGRWETALELLEAMRALAVPVGTITLNAVVDAVGKAGRSVEALRVFESIEEPTTVSFNVAMSACYRGGQHAEGFALFQRMGEGSAMPDKVSLNTAIALAEEAGLDSEVERLRAQVVPPPPADDK